jgi:hypothetical protein
MTDKKFVCWIRCTVHNIEFAADPLPKEFKDRNDKDNQQLLDGHECPYCLKQKIIDMYEVRHQRDLLLKVIDLKQTLVNKGVIDE